jgi:hypothetical protein
MPSVVGGGDWSPFLTAEKCWRVCFQAAEKPETGQSDKGGCSRIATNNVRIGCSRRRVVRAGWLCQNARSPMSWSCKYLGETLGGGPGEIDACVVDLPSTVSRPAKGRVQRSRRSLQACGRHRVGRVGGIKCNRVATFGSAFRRVSPAVSTHTHTRVTQCNKWFGELTQGRLPQNSQ